MGITLPSGLSPLTRGNLFLKPASMRGRGPIPAHAGEPLLAVLAAGKLWAYPRSRGGTAGRDDIRIAPMGLSPLTRGNRMVGTENGTLTGPIPAHAGEPRHLTATLCPGWAYPRSRGGTVCGHQCVQQQGGLSPLTRGNHGQRVEMGQHLGPIPAHAGEPDAASCCPSQAGAYPRSRGGTDFGLQGCAFLAGLSPLTRGNLSSTGSSGGTTVKPGNFIDITGPWPGD